jgi:hypothetical protein
LIPFFYRRNKEESGKVKSVVFKIAVKESSYEQDYHVNDHPDDLVS